MDVFSQKNIYFAKKIHKVHIIYLQKVSYNRGTSRTVNKVNDIHNV